MKRILCIVPLLSLVFLAKGIDSDDDCAVQFKLEDRYLTIICNGSSDLELNGTIKVVNLSAKECKHKNNGIDVNFNCGVPFQPPFCSNTYYLVKANLVCNRTTKTQEKTFYIPISDLLPKPKLFLKSATNTTIQIEWNATVEDGAKYQVNYYENYPDNGYNFNTSHATYTLENLRPYTYYNVRVRVFTDKEYGNWSAVLRERTHIGVPYPPTNLQSLETTNTSIKIIGYDIKWINTLNNDESDKRINSSVYVIEDLKPYTNYSILVRAKTAAGLGNWSNPIVIPTDIGVPFPPNNFQEKSTTSRSITLEWEEPVISTGPILNYTLSCSRINKKRSSRESDSRGFYNTSETNFTVTRLQPGYKYSFQVSATTVAGMGNWTEPLEIKTKSERPEKPTYIGTKNITNITIEVEWKKPAYVGPITNYSVKWTNQNSGVIAEGYTKETFFLIEGLDPYTNYTILVQAETEAGFGGAAELPFVLTSVGVPYPPMNLLIKNKTDTSIKVQWSSPEINVGPILWYLIRWTNIVSNYTSSDYANDSDTFLIQNVSPYSNYSIQVQAETDAGRGNWSEPIFIQTDIGVPFPPTNLQKSNTTNTSIEVRWDDPEIDVGPILYYDIKWINTLNELKTSKEDIENRRFVIKILKPYTNYSIEVRVKTAAGPGNWSNPVVIPTDIGVPYPPMNLHVLNTTDTSISVGWDEPEINVGPILIYRIEWIHSVTDKKGENVTPDKVFIIKDLKPHTSYFIQVQAETEAGVGNWSHLIMNRTDIGVPHPPTNLHYLEITNTSITVGWEESIYYTGPITRYFIKWIEAVSGNENMNETEGNGIVIKNLKPYTYYSISVQAETEAGRGNWSNATLIQTSIGVPYPPKNLNLINVTDTSIEVGWDEPEINVGPILGYQIKWIDTANDDESKNMTQHKVSLIKELKPYTNYSIVVQAKTFAGLGSWSDTIAVRTNVGVPSIPTNITTQATNTSIEVFWSEPEPFKGPILNYTIRWRSSKPNSNRKSSTNYSGYSIPDLTPYTRYYIQLNAITEAGESSWTKEIQVNTLVGVPYSPKKVREKSITNTSIIVTWEAPEPNVGPIIRYIVKWTNKEKDATQKQIVVGETLTDIKNLNPYTYYSIVVQGETEAGSGKWSLPFTVQTHIGVPSSPRNVSEEEKNATSLRLTWLEPNPRNGPLLGYKIVWGEKENSQKFTNELKENHLELLSLLPYTEYVFQVTARTAAGWGNSSSFTTWTDIAVPPAAKILSTAVENSSVLIVQWKTESPYPGPSSYKMFTKKLPGLCESNEQLHKTTTGSRSKEEWDQLSKLLVGQLVAFSQYSVRIVLKTEAGEKTSRESSPVWTPPQAPGPPTNLRANCEDDSTEAEVSWSMPKDPNANITHYLVAYGTKNLGYHELSVNVFNVCQVHKIKIRGLRPEQNYEIFVRAISKNVSKEGIRAGLGRYCTLPAGIPPVGNTQHIEVKGSDPYSLSLKWNNAVFSDVMGALIQYSVIIGYPNSIGKASLGKIPDEIPPWKNYSTGASGVYQATPEGWNPFHENDGQEDPLNCKIISDEAQYDTRECTLGSEFKCSVNKSECNSPLEPDTLYGIKIRAYTRGGYSETAPIFFRTAKIPKSNLIGALLGTFFSLIILGSIVFGLFIIRKKGGYANVRKIIELRFIRSSVNPPTEPAVELETYDHDRSHHIHNFCNHVRYMLSDSHLRFSEEFENLKLNSPKFTCQAAEMDENRHKNRWMNIFPYDHSRVKLLPLSDEPGSDFINANYIVGDASPREYIASQGPLPNTVDDFWRMIWEQSTTMIVMLTQLVERGKVKCEQYWPLPGEAKYYGDIQVKTISESMLSSYIIRVFQLHLGSQERKIKQMHFTHWPDFGCPESPEDLLNFVRAVRDHLPRIRPGPILVHCSAGVGRTGTFISVDRLAQQLKHTDKINVFGTVMELRQHRINMVQTEDQYIYIHLCVKQLVMEILEPSNHDTEEAIYSNLAIEKN